MINERKVCFTDIGVKTFNKLNGCLNSLSIFSFMIVLTKDRNCWISNANITDRETVSISYLNVVLIWQG